MKSLQDRVVLVTGGAQGLGRAIATCLAEAGAQVVLGDVNATHVAQTAEALAGMGLRVEGVRLDVSDAVEIAHLVPEIAERYGRLDVLVNNAGTDVTKPLTELTVEEWDRVLSVNLRGPFLMARAVFPIMAAQPEGGHIVNITSTAAKRAWANASAYHASKWGLLGFSHGIHVEGREHRVKVTAVIPGGMQTAFILERFPDTDPGVLQPPENVAEVVKYVLLQPDESVIPEVTVIPLRETSWP